MGCAKCEAHRAAIKVAAKSGNVTATVAELRRATVTLGENAGRRLIQVARRPKT